MNPFIKSTGHLSVKHISKTQTTLVNNTEQLKDATRSRKTNKHQAPVSIENLRISTKVVLYFLVLQWELR